MPLIEPSTTQLSATKQPVDVSNIDETVHILGAGSMGLLWASKLTLAGCPVDLITRTARKVRHVHLLERDEEVELDIDSYTASTLTNIKTLIVATKAYNALAAVKSVAHALSPDSKILVLQNGMGSQQAIMQALPNMAVYAAVSTDGARRHRPFVVEHTGFGETTIGALGNNRDGYLEALIKHLDSDLVLKPADDIRIKMWRKLVINCCINALTAIHDIRNGELLSHPETASLLPQIIAECRQVAEQHDFGHALENMQARVEEVIGNTAQNYSSMHQDVFYQRETEIDFINGFILAESKRFGLDCPINQQLVERIKSMPIKP